MRTEPTPLERQHKLTQHITKWLALWSLLVYSTYKLNRTRKIAEDLFCMTRWRGVNSPRSKVVIFSHCCWWTNKKRRLIKCPLPNRLIDGFIDTSPELGWDWMKRSVTFLSPTIFKMTLSFWNGVFLQYSLFSHGTVLLASFWIVKFLKM